MIIWVLNALGIYWQWSAVEWFKLMPLPQLNRYYKDSGA